jgi:DNA-binding HxlR family transcriptional regulator
MCYASSMDKKTYGQPCVVAKTLDLIGERWTLLIIRDLLAGTLRFQDLQISLPGVAPNMLSDRLKTLEAHGLLRREFYSDHPPRAAYALTAKGRELGLVVLALVRWGSRHLGGTASTVAYHEECERPIELQPYCPHCDSAVPHGAIKVRRSAVRSPPDRGVDVGTPDGVGARRRRSPAAGSSSNRKRIAGK